MYRLKKRSNPQLQPAAKVKPASAESTSQHNNNPTYTQHSETADDQQYHTVQTLEYAYIEHNTTPQGNADEDVYTYAETPASRNLPLSPDTDATEEGWKDNTIYVTTDDASTQNAKEGWTDNSVYGK